MLIRIIIFIDGETEVVTKTQNQIWLQNPNF